MNLPKTKKIINVQGCEISVLHTQQGEYISLTDMASKFGGTNLIDNWLRNKNTLEFLAVWERIYNPTFNSLEFEGIKNASGSNRFVISVKQWTEKTGAIGIAARPGRHGNGTFAHEEVAMEFATWLSPEFRLYVLKEFKRLKEEDSRRDNVDWDIRRVLAKANYRVHTDAIKDTLIPALKLQKDKEWQAYTSEADMLNCALFGMTANQWRQKNPDFPKDGNIRDGADLVQLTILSNLESLNAAFIREGMPMRDSYYRLCEIARQQYESLSKSTALNKGATLFNVPKLLPGPKQATRPMKALPEVNVKGKFALIKEQIKKPTPED